MMLDTLYQTSFGWFKSTRLGEVFVPTKEKLAYKGHCHLDEEGQVILSDTDKKLSDYVSHDSIMTVTIYSPVDPM